MRPFSFVVVLLLSVLAGAQGVSLPEPASASLASGVEAFKAGYYEEATRDFEAAVEAAPGSRVAHIYLGTALSYRVVPNLDTKENLAIAGRALDQFKQVLDEDPNNLEVLRQVASIQRNIRHLDEAIATERKVIAIAPNDAEAHYTIGVIEWTDAYKFAAQTLGDESLMDDGNGNVKLSAEGRNTLISHNLPLVNDAIAELTQAVAIRPTYDDAMQYLNLAYRRRADFDCTDAAQCAQDLATASEWVKRAIAARKANEQQKEQMFLLHSN